MDLFQVADYYVNKIVNTDSKKISDHAISNNQPHIKVLLLDEDTVETISMCTTQSTLLENQIYLVDKLENQTNRDFMRQLRCLCYVKPTEGTVDYLCEELHNPKYGEYQLFFNNTVSKQQLERLASSDDLEVVTLVQELFQDYLIVNADLFSLDISSEKMFTENNVWNFNILQDVTNSLISLLLSLKIKPIVYYQNTSNNNRILKLAQNVSSEINKYDKKLFDFPTQDSAPILLILDRSIDPLTPLLQPWTYQSMIHEYIGIRRNVVNLADKVADLSDKELSKVVLSSKQDLFFKESMYLNFGDLGDKVKNYLTDYKEKTKSNKNIQTINDIKEFIAKFPEFKKLSSNVAKHMTIVGELDTQLKKNQIWSISELEQNVSVHSDENEDYQTILGLFKDPQIANFYKLKLALIYCLRFEDKIQDVTNSLSGILPPDDINFIYRFIKYFKKNNSGGTLGGESNKNDDLLSGLAKKFNHTLHTKQADNVYMQHDPELLNILVELSQNKPLDPSKFSKVGGNPSSSSTNILPQDIVIFIVGGVTLEEARIIHEFNNSAKNANMRVILGGTIIHNTKSFIKECKHMLSPNNPSTQLTDLL
ncbi:related to Vacuolar protein sorting-associated protein 45 [Saccharomycodes ludwigii]|uniref:Related to Vacuolar protein sorting-associated protein 45 n=1 Tax=Saccharomycodes ludwigii TaxID=36035 RepID=A0A376B1W4_9ASCO|nr:hypothetical protein SCDLUD_001056 [Saccharomycodes ludwigii]KAH3903419.1 hypothetical protein SCDLUD_001056 [Saccharomycodes ludwigii]SSD58676.1 related to Vacuolar protein sorting-associated protein 45 [Saccharomycodes ludwigii]